MILADRKGLGKPQLIFWNRGAKMIFLAEIPKHPRHTEPWPYAPTFQGQAGEGVQGATLYAEGMDAYDIDGTEGWICWPVTTGSSTRAETISKPSKSARSAAGYGPASSSRASTRRW